MSQLSGKQRAKRNTDYLKKIFRTEDLAEARSELESAMSGGGGGGFGNLQVASPGHDERDPLESLDVLREDPTGSALRSGDHDRLEAIIHETGRPAYIIDSGSFTPNSQWDFLATGNIRKNIEAAIPSVGRIEVPKDFRPYAGTGFVVGENLLMTNRHVARIFASGIGTKMLKFDAGQIAGIDFLRELPGAGKPDPVFLEIDEVVMIHPYWDMALLRTKNLLPERHQPLKLSTKTPQDLAGRKVVVIGYPAKDNRSNLKVQEEIFGGRYQIKRLMPGEHDGAVNYAGQDVMAHDTSTLGGASGSAVLDVATGEIVGLHFAGEYMVSNYAVPTVSLAEDSRILKMGLRFEGVREARTTFYQPFWDKADKNETVVLDLDGERAVQEGSPAPDVDPLIGKFQFDSLKKSEFDWTTALSTALASHVAYFDEVQVRQTCDSWQLSKCHFIERDNTECFVAGDGDTAIVAFRGTEKRVADWLTDLNAVGTTKSYGRVHRGFWAAFQGVADLLDAAITDLGSPKLVLTGHSLGGALAVIAAAEWSGKYPIQSIYTYGQPAVGKGHFPEFMRQNYDSLFYRFVNDDDIVPMVPPLYRHTGQLYHLGPGNELKNRTESIFGGEETPTMTQEQFDRLRLELLRKRLEVEDGELGTQEGWLPNFRDHSLARYIQKIATNTTNR
jgi:hypothetical protein